MKVRVSNGKYTFVAHPGLRIAILRYDEPWHAQDTAGNALHSIMCELDAARVVLDACRKLVDPPIEIRRALARHRNLVDDREFPSEWTAT